MTTELAISPLQLDSLTRDYYGHYDAFVMSQLAPLANSDCYQPKFYKAPASSDEVIAAGGNAQYGLKITPGSLIYGFYLPGLIATLAPIPFSVQITDTTLRHKFYDEPVPSIFLANFKPTGLSTNPLLTAGAIFSFPSLLNAPYPVVGSGMFKVDLWNTGNAAARIQLIFGVLEVVGDCK
jgi:hypothetical protein